MFRTVKAAGLGFGKCSLTLIGVADRLGLISRAVKVPLEQVPDLRLPAILHWDMSHFVVLERVKKRRCPNSRPRWPQ